LSFISPESKRKRPTIQLNRVVFPQPLGPNSPYLKLKCNKPVIKTMYPQSIFFCLLIENRLYKLKIYKYAWIIVSLWHKITKHISISSSSIFRQPNV
jgi:hypothetical protein